MNDQITVDARSSFQAKVSDVWSRDVEERAATEGWYWMAHPMVVARVNTLISGDPACDAYGRLERLYRERGWTLPIAHAVSLGCGFGNLERDLMRRGWVGRIDAYDIAEGAIAEARRLAEQDGLHGITYHVSDLDTLQLAPGSIDAVFAHSAVHHVERLEALYATVHAALKPNGVFHLHEYVGPTRFQWTDAQIALVNDFMDSLPPRLRALPSGLPKGRMTRPTIEHMIATDPSEAVRSADLLAALQPWFEIVEERRTGGTLAHLALGDIAQNFAPDSAEDRAILQELFATEDAAMASGLIGSDFAIVTAVPRPQVKALRTPPAGEGPAVSPSAATRMSLRFPPARRLFDAVRYLNGATAKLAAEQEQSRAADAALRHDQARLFGAVARLTAEIAAARATLPPPAPTATVPEPPKAEDNPADPWVGRILQGAALRHLPFLPGEIGITENGIRVEGYAGAPEGLTANMAFFVNGRRIDQVEYPVLDAELASRFPDIRGMGFVVRALMTQHLNELKAARFWRFDASPTGRYIPANWRQAMHFMNPAMEAFPFPPVANIKRVIGDTSATRFTMGGASIFKNLETYLGELGYGWADFPDILDWGCGAGRVTRYLLSETKSAVTGADIDPDNIAWCRSAYPAGRFEVVPLRPPTAFADSSFNLVTGLSVMTHLQEDDQWKWLAELRRITKPGALVFLSVQGPTQYAYNCFPAHLYRQVEEQGYLDLTRDPALDDVIADSEYYRAAMHSRRYITERWGEYFEVLAIVDAIAGLQDFIVMRRR